MPRAGDRNHKSKNRRRPATWLFVVSAGRAERLTTRGSRRSAMPSDSSLMRRGTSGLSGVFRAGAFASSPASPVWPYVDLETRLPGLLRLFDWLGIAILGFTIDALFSWRGA